jgi:15-cis-phytoene synthase
VNLEECYEFCRAVQKAHSRTYHFSTRLFPPEIRRHVHALYAFTRHADEIVDDPKKGASAEARLEALEAFEAGTMAALVGEEVEDPILRAFTNTARECGIGQNHLKSFMRSMKMDIYVRRYPTYEDLKEYMYGSAAVVGLMMCRVIGVEAEEALPHAEALGEAMQLTNFLRDVREDWERGRVYLPLADLKRFGYSEEDLGTGRVNETFVELMRFEIERARMLYLIADQGMHHIPRGLRYPILVARHLYAAILERIEELDYDVFSGRAGTSFAEKLRVAAACAVHEPGEILSRGTNRRMATA